MCHLDYRRRRRRWRVQNTRVVDTLAPETPNPNPNANPNPNPNGLALTLTWVPNLWQVTSGPPGLSPFSLT